MAFTQEDHDKLIAGALRDIFAALETGIHPVGGKKLVIRPPVEYTKASDGRDNQHN